MISRGKGDNAAPNGIYEPPRGSLARTVLTMVDTDITPLITTRSALWAVIEKLRFFCHDYAGALACAEKAWRIATAGDAWLADVQKWKDAAATTDALVSAYENYGPQTATDGYGEVEKAWRLKARSAVRAVLGRARDVWGDTAECEMLRVRLEELKS